MLLQSGQWLGRGSLLPAGQSRGVPITSEVRVDRDEAGLTLTGHWQLAEQEAKDFVIRVAADDAGTYSLSLRLAALQLHGTAKLDSPPNLGLLWNEAGNLHATCSLFAVAAGCGCRGFVRQHGSRETLHTWEIAFSLKQALVQGDNVVSLHRRRR